MTTTHQSDPGSTRDQIPVVALRLFADKGYDATSMREIAEQLGITKAALYYHFDSKEDIVRSLVAAMMDQITELVQWAGDQPQSPGLRLEVLTRWSDIMQAHGLAMFRFIVSSGRVFQDAKRDPLGFTSRLNELIEILTLPEATVEDQLRLRVALMSINLAGIAGIGMDASEAEILTAARRIAIDLLPGHPAPHAAPSAAGP